MKKALSLVSLFTLTAATCAQAVTVAAWNPSGTATDIVDARTAMTVGEGTNALSTGTLSNPTIGTNDYYNNAGAGPVGAVASFYSAAYGLSDDGMSGPLVPQLNNYDVENGGGGDYIRMRVQGPDAASNTETNIIALWTKEYFLNGGDSGTVTLNGMSLLTETNGGSPVTRYVVQLGGSDFYVSEALSGLTNSFTDPLDVSWFNYSPTTDFTTIGSSAVLVASDFDDLTAAGAYMFKAGGRFNVLGLASIVVDGTVTPVPEPSFYAALAGLLALAVVARRRVARS